MLFAELLATAYLIFLVVNFYLAKAAIGDKAYRKLFAVVGAIMPFLFVWALIVTLFRPGKTNVHDADQVSTEDMIEAKRVSIFGGKPVNLSALWKKGYLLALERAANHVALASERIAYRFRMYSGHRGAFIVAAVMAADFRVVASVANSVRDIKAGHTISLEEAFANSLRITSA